MNEIAKLLMPSTTETAPFPADSRYHGLPVLAMALPDGREVRVVGRRFIPSRESIEVSAVHSVRGGDRLDLLAARYFGNPTQGWKLLDANGIRDARGALSEIGSRLAIGTALAIQGQSYE